MFSCGDHKTKGKVKLAATLVRTHKGLKRLDRTLQKTLPNSILKQLQQKVNMTCTQFLCFFHLKNSLSQWSVCCSVLVHITIYGWVIQVVKNLVELNCTIRHLNRIKNKTKNFDKVKIELNHNNRLNKTAIKWTEFYGTKLEVFSKEHENFWRLKK